MESELDELVELAGFTEYEKEIYKALYRLETATVKEVYDRSNVPKSKTYKVMDELHKKGYIALEGKEPKTYSIIPPETAFSSLQKQKKKEAERIKELVQETGSRGFPEQDDSFLKVMRGKTNVLNFLTRQLKDRTDQEYVAISPLTSSNTPLQPVMRERSDEIPIKILGSRETSRRFIVRKYLNVGADVKLREFPSAPLQFSIYDREKIAFTISDQENGYITIWTNHTGFVENMRELFQYQWEQSVLPNTENIMKHIEKQ